jgi:hypothetical protein
LQDFEEAQKRFKAAPPDFAIIVPEHRDLDSLLPLVSELSEVSGRAEGELVYALTITKGDSKLHGVLTCITRPERCAGYIPLNYLNMLSRISSLLI